jgi:ribose/xylose/arabinose/galactoside ABC-type transport system permease subunit
MTRLADLALRHATLLIFVVVLLWFGLQTPGFLAPESLGNIVKQSAFIGIAAIGITFVLLTAGIDLSVGSIMYLAPLIAGFAMRDAGIGVAGGLLVAILAGALLGAINAAAIVGLRIIPFIVTLATLFAFRGFGAFLTGSTQFDFEADMRAFGQAALGPVPMPIIVFAILALAAHIVLSRTTFGRQVYAVGNDPEAARKAGLPVAWVQARVYLISGACAGLAGFVVISQIGRLDAGFGEGREFDVIAAAVLGGASLFGGIGSAFGAVVGATLIQTVKSGLVFTGVNLYLQPILMAGIIFLAVLIDSLRARRLSQRKRRTIRPTEA